MTCAPCMAGLGASMNTYNGPVPPGVPNPYTVMLHSYPTRYHGPIYTRPQFGLEWATRPNDFGLEEGMMGLGDPDGDSSTTERLSQSPAYQVLGMVGMGAGAYHGYKRNNSVGWAVVWGLLGSMVPIIVLPVALAQGFGKPKR